MTLRLFLIAPSAMLTDHLPHGDGLVSYGFIRELTRRGHEIHVGAGQVELRVRSPQNLHVHPLGRPSGKLGRARFMRDLRALWGRLDQEVGFDLIHQLTPVEVGVSLAMAGIPRPVVLGPYVPDWAASGAGADAQVSRTALEAKRILRAAQQWRATSALVSTPAARAKLEPRAGNGLHVRELPLGVDDEAWSPAPDVDDGRQSQQVLFLANLEVRKGIHVLLDAFEELAPQLPEARLVVAGGGPEEEPIRRRIASSGALERVELAGHVERERARAMMQSCDVYCLPSFGDPCPLAAVEAMACARPVVATNASGLGYLVPEGGGRKVPPGDARSLAGALGEVLADPGLRRAMGQHNRRIVEERFAWARVADRLETLYAEAIANPRRQREATSA